jgi:hypothetical protein
MEDFGLVDFRVTKLNPRNWNLPDGTTRFPIISPRVYTLFICLIALVFQITTTPPIFFFETYASWLEEAQASARTQSLRVTLHPNGWVNHHGKLSVHCLNLNRPRGEGGQLSDRRVIHIHIHPLPCWDRPDNKKISSCNFGQHFISILLYTMFAHAFLDYHL